LILLRSHLIALLQNPFTKLLHSIYTLLKFVTYNLAEKKIEGCEIKIKFGRLPFIISIGGTEKNNWDSVYSTVPIRTKERVDLLDTREIS
jgi:hypothetical protein